MVGDMENAHLRLLDQRGVGPIEARLRDVIDARKVVITGNRAWDENGLG